MRLPFEEKLKFDGCIALIALVVLIAMSALVAASIGGLLAWMVVG